MRISSHGLSTICLCAMVASWVYLGWQAQDHESESHELLLTRCCTYRRCAVDCQPDVTPALD